MGKQAGKGGELSGKETTIISGALELTEKTTRDAMTPVSEIFAVDIIARLDRYNESLLWETNSSSLRTYLIALVRFIDLCPQKNHYALLYVTMW